MGESKKLIEEVPTLELYFHEKVTEAIRHQQIEADDHVTFYLVNLLSSSTRMENLPTDEDGENTPLAILLAKSQTEDLQNKMKMLKHMGDFSLLIAGFFQDSLNRKLVDLDYYIAMGGVAYQQLSTLNVYKKNQALFSMIFSELASRFVKWVDVLSEVSEESQITTHADILRLYEKFLRTGSDRLRSMLTHKGIFANTSWESTYSQ